MPNGRADRCFRRNPSLDGNVEEEVERFPSAGLVILHKPLFHSITETMSNFSSKPNPLSIQGGPSGREPGFG